MLQLPRSPDREGSSGVKEIQTAELDTTSCKHTAAANACICLAITHSVPLPTSEFLADIFVDTFNGHFQTFVDTLVRQRFECVKPKPHKIIVTTTTTFHLNNISFASLSPPASLSSS